MHGETLKFEFILFFYHCIIYIFSADVEQ